MSAKQFFVGLVTVTVPDLFQRCDIFLKKRMEEMFAYDLELILALAKTQNNSIK